MPLEDAKERAANLEAEIKTLERYDLRMVSPFARSLLLFTKL